MISKFQAAVKLSLCDIKLKSVDFYLFFNLFTTNNAHM